MDICLFIKWNIKPEIFQTEFISLRWYGLLFALGFVVAYQILKWIYLKEGRLIKNLDILTVYVVVGTIAGARLGHVLFYEPSDYLKNPIDIFKIWEGGLASHGAVIGILVATYLYSRKHAENYLWLLDRLAISVAIAGCLVRIGNLMNSEIIGSATNVPWAFIFLNVDNVPRHPAQLYEAISYLILFFILMRYYKRTKELTPPGSILGLLLIGIFTMRFLLEFLKENQVQFESNLIFNMGQVLSIPLIIAGIILFFNSQKKSSQQ